MLVNSIEDKEEPLIETERLTVRKFIESDYSDLYEYLSQESVYKYEPGEPITIEESKKLSAERARGEQFFAVILKQNGKMIGHLYLEQILPKDRLTWELGYIFNPNYQHKGYASESANALVEYALKELKVHRVMARCNPDNAASWRLLERIGFKREGNFKKYGFVHKDENNNPIWTDAYEYSRIEE